MRPYFVTQTRRLTTATLFLTLLSACSPLLPTPTAQPRLYALSPAENKAPPATATGAATLLVSPPQAAAGFDSRHIIYVRQPYQLEYYAHSEWVDTPARMLAPLIVSAIEDTAAFAAVIVSPSGASGDLTLHVEIIRLQHEVSHQPAQARFTLRAYLVANATRQVIASREFEQTVIADSETPYGGVQAANRAVHRVLQELAGFCQEIGQNWAKIPVDRRTMKLN
ncbi:MAG: hypothetical protein CVU16_09745 [Betaproteobacteria bacterium HGW-Betaproteobacteria-10]|nr:MAG: hypothetical protein CVU16_09745 [Betaproteobacteria bacterium HGW-Betaproteobacteria-10]